jgi:sugar phosphate isomerase/epimerase
MKQPPPVLKAGQDPNSVEDGDYLDRVIAAAAEAKMPFGGIAVDGAHIYEPTEEARQANRSLAYQWLDVAAKLGAGQMRVDAGGPEDMPDDAFKIIVEGYQDLVARGREKGVEILIENHWGPARHPENVVKILEAVDGLGLLFDTNNWAPGAQERAWPMCAKYAKATHIKTFEFDAAGNDPTVDLEKAIHLLVESGYEGCWGIESVPRNGNEYEGAKKTIELIQRVLS